jgi:hypothetical protein
MPTALFYGLRSRVSRDEAIERYILLRLRFDDIQRLGFLVEGGGCARTGRASKGSRSNRAS